MLKSMFGDDCTSLLYAATNNMKPRLSREEPRKLSESRQQSLQLLYDFIPEVYLSSYPPKIEVRAPSNNTAAEPEGNSNAGVRKTTTLQTRANNVTSVLGIDASGFSKRALEAIDKATALPKKKKVQLSITSYGLQGKRNIDSSPSKVPSKKPKTSRNESLDLVFKPDVPDPKDEEYFICRYPGCTKDWNDMEGEFYGGNNNSYNICIIL
jgi:hypothetical protein